MLLVGLNELSAGGLWTPVIGIKATGYKLRKHLPLEQERSSAFYRLLEETYQRPCGRLPADHMVTFCRFQKGEVRGLRGPPPGLIHSSQEIDTIGRHLTSGRKLKSPNLKKHFIKSLPYRLPSQETLLPTPLMSHLPSVHCQ